MAQGSSDLPIVIMDGAFELTEPLGLTLTPNVSSDVEPGLYSAHAIRADGARNNFRLKLEWVHFSPGGSPGSTTHRTCETPSLPFSRTPMSRRPG
jgi:hypothetical protein